MIEVYNALPVALAFNDADASSVVFALIFITISPLWVPALMASNAPFRVVNEPEAVPEVAVRVTCEKPALENRSKKQMKIDLMHKRFFSIIEGHGFSLFRNMNMNNENGR